MTTEVSPIMPRLSDACQGMSNFMKDNRLGPTQAGPVRHNAN